MAEYSSIIRDLQQKQPLDDHLLTQEEIAAFIEEGVGRPISVQRVEQALNWLPLLDELKGFHVVDFLRQQEDSRFIALRCDQEDVQQSLLSIWDYLLIDPALIEVFYHAQVLACYKVDLFFHPHFLVKAREPTVTIQGKVSQMVETMRDTYRELATFYQLENTSDFTNELFGLGMLDPKCQARMGLVHRLKEFDTFKPYEADMIRNAARGGSLECMQYLCSLDPPFPWILVDASYFCHSLQLFRYVLYHGCFNFGSRFATHGVPVHNNGRVAEITLTDIKRLIETGHPVNDDLLRHAARSGVTEGVQYLLAQYPLLKGQTTLRGAFRSSLQYGFVNPARFLYAKYLELYADTQEPLYTNLALFFEIIFAGKSLECFQFIREILPDIHLDISEERSLMLVARAGLKVATAWLQGVDEDIQVKLNHVEQVELDVIRLFHERGLLDDNVIIDSFYLHFKWDNDGVRYYEHLDSIRLLVSLGYKLQPLLVHVAGKYGRLDVTRRRIHARMRNMIDFFQRADPDLDLSPLTSIAY